MFKRNIPTLHMYNLRNVYARGGDNVRQSITFLATIPTWNAPTSNRIFLLFAKLHILIERITWSALGGDRSGFYSSGFKPDPEYIRNDQTHWEN